MKGVSQSFEFVGRVKAIDKVELRARVEGFLDKVLFREGQDVKAATCSIRSRRCSSGAGRPGQGECRRRRKPRRPTLGCNTTAASLSASSAPKARRPEEGLAGPRKARSCRRKAALTQAEVNLDYTDIRSPIDGRIGRVRAYTIGNLVNPASGVLATIVSQDPIYMLFPVSVRTRSFARRGARKAACQDQIRSACRWRIRAARRLESDRPPSRPADRHADHAGHHRQSRRA